MNVVAVYKGDAKVVKCVAGDVAFLIGVDGLVKCCDVKDLEMVAGKDLSFESWLKENYSYDKPMDMWRNKEGKVFTESYLEIEFLLK